MGLKAKVIVGRVLRVRGLEGNSEASLGKSQRRGTFKKQAATYKTAAFQGSKLGVTRRED
jgi:hypothetical protein